MHFSQTLYFLLLTLVLSVVALATSGWSCGNIVVSCHGGTKPQKMLFLTAKSLMLIGSGLLVLAIVMEVISCCLDGNDKSSRSPSRSFAVCRAVAAIFALFALLSGMLIVTHLIGDVFSYMSMVMAVGFAIHCNTLLFQTISCSTGTTKSIK